MGGSGIGKTVGGLICAVLVLGSLWASKPDSSNGAKDPQEAQVREAIESALKDAAVAQESFRTQSPSYTTDINALVATGLQPSADVPLNLTFADENGYCIDAGTPDLQYRYWSEEGLPVEGTCAEVVPAATEVQPDTQAVESVLKNMATAQESYRTGHPSYTEDIKDLQKEGLQIDPSLAVRVRHADKSSYCMEARGQGPVFFYYSNKGAPIEGSCTKKMLR